MKIKIKIKEIVGSFLVDHGFALLNEKGGASATNYTYTRKSGMLTQYVCIGKSILGKEMGLTMQTDAWGFPFADPRDIIPELANTFDVTKGLSLEQDTIVLIKAISLSKYSMNERANWPYESEEELEKALWEIREVIEKYGLAWLDKKCIEEQIIPTDEMGNKLYQSYEELYKCFAERHHIDTTDKSKENIAKSFAVVRARLEEIQYLPYSEVQDDLVEMAAFWGEQLRGKFGGVWKQMDRGRLTSVRGLKTYILRNNYPLDDIVKAFKTSNFDLYEKNCLVVLEGELPLTGKQMLEYQEKLKMLSSASNKT